MKLIKTKCPTCVVETHMLAWGVVAPWISELCGSAPNTTRLCKCPKCSLVFFSYRYSEIEMERIYSGYRNAHFYKTRHRWEPWYNSSVNEAFSRIDDDNPQLKNRRKFTRDLLDATDLGARNLNGCIDYGGDLGQFIPDGVFSPFYVVEKGSSSKQSRLDVLFVDSLSEISGVVDLVTNCYVLEHSSDLRFVVSDMKSKLRSGGIVLVEVPLDKFRTSLLHRTRMYRTYLELLVRFRSLFVFIDFLSGVYRHCFRRIPWFGIVKQSEHINYFDSEALRYMIESQGGSVIHMSSMDFNYKVGNIRQGRLGCIFQ